MKRGTRIQTSVLLMKHLWSLFSEPDTVLGPAPRELKDTKRQIVIKFSKVSARIQVCVWVGIRYRFRVWARIKVRSEFRISVRIRVKVECSSSLPVLGSDRR